MDLASLRQIIISSKEFDVFLKMLLDIKGYCNIVIKWGKSEYSFFFIIIKVVEKKKVIERRKRVLVNARVTSFFFLPDYVMLC